MILPEWLAISDEVQAALCDHRPVVALESTLIAHGLPWPVNLETAQAAEIAVRDAGAIPATIAVWKGKPTIGLSRKQIADFAQMQGVLKVSRRDLAGAMLRGQTAASTVAATMALAHAAGISVFATGGIGGAHRDTIQPFDISADLSELARTPMLVVCAGAKSILDLAKTLEVLETWSVPVVGYQTTDFPAFYVRESGLRVSDRIESPSEAATWFNIHRAIGGKGMVLAQPVSAEVALTADEFNEAFSSAEVAALNQAVRGAELTPFLLKTLAEITQGRSLRANRALIVSNAKLAAEIAIALFKS